MQSFLTSNGEPFLGDWILMLGSEEGWSQNVAMAPKEGLFGIWKDW